MYKYTDKQVQRLISACEDLAAYFAMDAARVIVEWPDDANIVEYLQNLPVKIVRQFDEAVVAITHPDADYSEEHEDDRSLRLRYEAALKEMREARNGR